MLPSLMAAIITQHRRISRQELLRHVDDHLPVGAVLTDEQTHQRLAEEVKKRRPLLLFFVSAQLLDAANLPEVLEALEPVLAHPAEPVRRITDLRLRVTAQRWVKALCFGLPMPRKTFTPETEETIAAGIAAIFRREELLPS